MFKRTIEPINIPDLTRRHDVVFEAAACCPDTMSWGKNWLINLERELDHLVNVAQFSEAKRKTMAE